MAGTDDVESESTDEVVQLVQGDLWKSVEINKNEIANNKVIGQVSAGLVFVVCSQKQPMSDTNFVLIVLLLLRDRFPPSSSAPSVDKMQH